MSFVNFDDYDDDEVVHKPEPLKIKPNNENLYDYHDSISYNKCIYEKFINDLSVTESINILNNNTTEIEHEVTTDIIKKLMKDIRIIKNSDIGLMKFDVLIQFLLREDYSFCEYNLEQELGNMAVYWIAENNETITEDEYKMIWTNLRQSLLGSKLSGMFYKFSKYPDLNKNFAELYTSFVIVDPNYNSKQRYITYEQNKEIKNILNINQEIELIINNILDVKKDNKWYVAKIKNIDDEGITITYYDLTEYLIPFGTSSFAILGTYTNGILHKNEQSCGCNICIEKLLCPCNDPECLINTMMNSLTELSGIINNKQETQNIHQVEQLMLFMNMMKNKMEKQEIDSVD